MKTLSSKARLVLVLALGTIVPPVFAAGVVSTCNEASLRSALAGGGAVTFTCDGTLLLTNTIVITSDTSLDATGHKLILSGGNAIRIVTLNPGATLSVSNVVFTGGRSTNGGALYNAGTVNLNGCLFTNNAAIGLNGTTGLTGASSTNSAGSPGGPGNPGTDARGGAIFNIGTLNLTNVQFHGNFAQGGQGGLGGTGGDGNIVYQRQFVIDGSIGGVGGMGGMGGGAYGGAVNNEGVMTSKDSSWERNTATAGTGGKGGPHGYGFDNTGSGNGALSGKGGTGGPAQGGAIWNAGTFNSSGSTLYRNQASGGAGGDGGPAALVANYIAGLGGVAGGGTGNHGEGGGIWNLGSNFLVNCTLVQNTASGGWSGVYGENPNPFPAPGSLPPKSGDGGDALGGGLRDLSPSALTSCTIWNNLAVGGLSTNRIWPTGYNANGPGPVNLNLGSAGTAQGSSIASTNGATTLTNTLVGGLFTTNNCNGPVTDGGHNFCSDATAGFSAPGSANNINPKLGPLADNGGPTKTLALMPDSPAIDAGMTVVGVDADQRGVARPYGSAPDIGAYEWNNTSAYPPLSIAGVSLTNGQPWVRAAGTPGQTVRIQRSVNFANWNDCGTNILDGDGQQFFSDLATNVPAPRYYRAVTP